MSGSDAVTSRRFWLTILSLSLCAGPVAAGAEQQSLVIKAGVIWTVTGGTIADGLVIIENGKISAVGANLAIPEGAKILEMPDKHVMPGLIDGHCHLGLSLDAFAETEETVSAVTPDMQILDAFNPLAADVEKALRSGVTTVLLAPGYKNPIAGQMAIVKLPGGGKDAGVVQRSAGVKFSLGNETLMSDRRPTSRPGLIAQVREELNTASQYQESKFDARAEILKQVVQGQLPVHIYCNAVDEILAAIKLIDEYQLKATLVAAREADELASMIAERNIPLIYMPTLLLSKDKDLKRVGKIAAAGVKVAFASYTPRTNLSDLRTSAVIAAKFGLAPELALKGLTVNAAEILGLAQRLGSIEPGKDADLVILSGDPLEPTSGVEMVIIDGSIVYQREQK
jgi:imidazolonepropionase-like amidohydrolase